MMFSLEEDFIRPLSTENAVLFRPKDRVDFKLLILWCTIEAIKIKNSRTAHRRQRW